MVNVRRFKGERGFWAKSVKGYYLSKTDCKKLHQVATEHGISKIAALNKEKIKRENLIPIMMDFGESCASWYLETNEKIIFIKLRWVESPFERQTGVDLVGVRPESQEICYCEAKARNDPHVSGTIRDIAIQLAKTRLDKKLNSPIGGYGSKKWIVQNLEKLELEKKIIDNVLDKSDYIRFGVVLHPRRNSPLVFGEFNDILGGDLDKVTFVDYEIEDFESEIDAFVEVIAIPRS